MVATMLLRFLFIALFFLALQSFDDCHDLFELFIAGSLVTFVEYIRDAVPKMLFEDDLADRLKSSAGGLNLDDDVQTAFIIADHSMNPSHLSLYAAKSVEVVICISFHRYPIFHCVYLSDTPM